MEHTGASEHEHVINHTATGKKDGGGGYIEAAVKRMVISIEQSPIYSRLQKGCVSQFIGLTPFTQYYPERSLWAYGSLTQCKLPLNGPFNKCFEVYNECTGIEPGMCLAWFQTVTATFDRTLGVIELFVNYRWGSRFKSARDTRISGLTPS